MNKTIDYYMSLPYRTEIVEDKTDGGYAVSFPDLRGCISCGGSLESAYTNAIDAKKEWLLAMLEEGMPIPEPANSESPG